MQLACHIARRVGEQTLSETAADAKCLVAYWCLRSNSCPQDQRFSPEFQEPLRLSLEKGKGNEEYLYSAFIQRLISWRSDMDHTVLPANYTMSAFS